MGNREHSKASSRAAAFGTAGVRITPGQRNSPAKHCQANREPRTPRRTPGRISREKEQGVPDLAASAAHHDLQPPPGCIPGTESRAAGAALPGPGFRGGSERVPNPHKRQPKIVSAVNVTLTGVRSREIPASLLPPTPPAHTQALKNRPQAAPATGTGPGPRLPHPAARTPLPSQRRGRAALPEPRTTFVYFSHLPVSLWRRRWARCSLQAHTPTIFIYIYINTREVGEQRCAFLPATQINQAAPKGVFPPSPRRKPLTHRHSELLLQ